MQANDLLKYRNKIIKAFQDGTFLPEYLKKSDDAAYNYVLKVVNKFIEKIKSKEQKTNLSLFEEFFEYSPADYAKMIVNTKNRDENKKNVEEIENRISDLKDRIKKMSKKEKKECKWDIRDYWKILDYNKDAQIFFYCASKIDKEKSEPKIEESIAERVKLKNNRVAEIKKEEKNINNKLFNFCFSKYQNPSDMYKKLRETKDKKNEDQVYSIKEILDQTKSKIKNLPENKRFMIEGNERIINIREHILYFNQLEQHGLGKNINTKSNA